MKTGDTIYVPDHTGKNRDFPCVAVDFAGGRAWDMEDIDGTIYTDGDGPWRIRCRLTREWTATEYAAEFERGEDGGELDDSSILSIDDDQEGDE